MYHDFKNTSRADWKFTYKGSDLSVPARHVLNTYIDKEKVAREKVSQLMLDRTKPANGEDAQKAQRDVETNASILEQVKVWVHEFERTPERDFHLSLGDVVFFGLVEI